MTREARSRNLPIIEAAIPSTPITIVDIPDGKCEDEIWDIFSIVTDSVHENDDLSLISHTGFDPAVYCPAFDCVFEGNKTLFTVWCGVWRV